MNRILHNQFSFGTCIDDIKSPAYYDCVIHVICLAGNCSFKFNDELFSLTKNDVAIITTPRVLKEIKCDEEFKCEYLVAPEEYLHSLLPANNYSIIGRVSLYDNPVIKLSEDEAKTLSYDFHIIAARISETEHLYYREMIGGLCRAMIYDLFDFHARHNENMLITNRVSYVSKRFFSMIQEGLPATQREPSFYAEAMNVSVKYLSETIKRLTGDSVSVHINRAAVAIILDYLKANRLSITQIAELMNFSSVQYFSRYCLKHIGKSPSKIHQ